MAAIDTFKRVEDKYQMTEEQYEEFMELAAPYLQKDKFFEYTCRNIYFDTDRYDLIVHSLSSPAYKAKIRLRGYGSDADNDTVFLETKKKYQNIVYKRRFQMTESEAKAYLEYGIPHGTHSNTADELDYLLKLYNPEGKVFIAYDRTCFADKEHADVRVTFDRNIRFRNHNLSMHEDGTERQAQEGLVLMEIKAMDRYPMWLVRILSSMHLYKAGFSKYGLIYKTYLRNENRAPAAWRTSQQPGMAHKLYRTGKETTSCLAQY